MISELQRKGTAPKGEKMKIVCNMYEIEITAKDLTGVTDDNEALSTILTNLASMCFTASDAYKFKERPNRATIATKYATALTEASDTIEQ